MNIKNIKENKASPQLRYYRKNREKVLAKRKLKYKDPIVKENQYKSVKKWRANNQEKFNKKMRKSNERYRRKYPQRVREKNAHEYKELRLMAMSALGGAFCKKCNFKDYRALQIDHINGGGFKHRKTFSSNNAYFRFVINNSYMFQVLCANCNRIKIYTNKEVRKRYDLENKD